METVVITGGIAMGKSTVMKLLRAGMPEAEIFDSDATVQKLLTEEAILARIAAEFGDSILNPDGQLDRPQLRKQVFDNVHRRAALESILHPEVRREFRERRSAASSADGTPCLFADIPLFFESDYRFEHDLVVVVATRPETQWARVMARPGMTESIARGIIDAQLPTEEKVKQADVVFWNDGSESALAEQIQLFIQCLKTRK